MCVCVTILWETKLFYTWMKTKTRELFKQQIYLNAIAFIKQEHLVPCY